MIENERKFNKKIPNIRIPPKWILKNCPNYYNYIRLILTKYEMN